MSFIVIACICANLLYQDIQCEYSIPASHKFTPHSRVSHVETLKVNVSEVFCVLVDFSFADKKLFRVVIYQGQIHLTAVDLMPQTKSIQIATHQGRYK